MTSGGPTIVAGARGILGSAFMARMPAALGLGRDDLDPGAPEAVVRNIVARRPSLIINCAADTDVEGAENDDSRAIAVNVTLAAALAKAAADSGAGFVHFSSTGCYGTYKNAPYEESDPLHPTTAHHRSKALGEAAVLNACPAAIILRLGWVFGGAPGQRKNFVWARLREAEGKAAIGSNPHQLGSPTSAADVVTQVLNLLAQEPGSGVFNCVGNGPPGSRLEYVAVILAAAGSPTRVEAASFTRRAAVSPNEAAVNARLQQMGLDIMRPWRDALRECVLGLSVSL